MKNFSKWVGFLTKVSITKILEFQKALYVLSLTTLTLSNCMLARFSFTVFSRMVDIFFSIFSILKDTYVIFVYFKLVQLLQ